MLPICYCWHVQGFPLLQHPDRGAPSTPVSRDVEMAEAGAPDPKAAVAAATAAAAAATAAAAAAEEALKVFALGGPQAEAQVRR
jgi:hypothetical protein